MRRCSVNCASGKFPLSVNAITKCSSWVAFNFALIFMSSDWLHEDVTLVVVIVLWTCQIEKFLATNCILNVLTMNFVSLIYGAKNCKDAAFRAYITASSSSLHLKSSFCFVRLCEQCCVMEIMLCCDSWDTFLSQLAFHNPELLKSELKLSWALVSLCH